MKSVKILIAATLAILVSASCDRKVEFEHETFATFNAVSYIVDENVGELKIPVTVYNPTGSDLQVVIKTVDGEGEAGKDYEVVTPSSGILTFSGDQATQDIVISITNHEGEFTGSLDFTVEISSATEALSIGNFKTAKVAINDLDHPLSTFFGTWSATTFEEVYLEAYVTLSFNMMADPNNLEKLVISLVDPMMSSVVGYSSPVVLSADAVLNEDGTGEIVIPNGQYTGFTYSYGPWTYYGYDAASFGSATAYANIVMNLGPDGITVPNGFGIFDDNYIWASYVGGYTLVKQ